MLENQELQGFKRLWDMIYNPKSGSPDVSLDYILTCMTQIVTQNETIKEKVLAFVKISGPVCYMDVETFLLNSIKLDLPPISDSWLHNGKPSSEEEEAIDNAYAKHNLAVEEIKKELQMALDSLVDESKINFDGSFYK